MLFERSTCIINITNFAMLLFYSKYPICRPVPSQLHIKIRITSNLAIIYIDLPTILYSLRTTIFTSSYSLQKQSTSLLSKEAKIKTLSLFSTNPSIPITL